jgi:hypothetical protein
MHHCGYGAPKSTDNFFFWGGGGQEIKSFFYHQGVLVIMLFNPLNGELNPIWHLLALLGAHHILHVSRIRVNMHKKLCAETLMYINWEC